ncbi:hypothetical protein DBX26_18835 [Vibrio sp. dhg]|nr:hypothetical protein DBX26_18835 [Vibrio sp. dhg]
MQIIENLAGKIYFHTHQIVVYVEAEFGIRYTVADMNQRLHHNGFSYKNIQGVPRKLNFEQQQVVLRITKP